MWWCGCGGGSSALVTYVHVGLLDARHEAKVDEGDLVLARLVVEAHQVPRVRVRVEQAKLQELREEGLLRDGRELCDFLCRRIAQLAPVDPLAYEEPPGREGEVDLRHEHALAPGLRELDPEGFLVGRLVDEVELSVEPDSPLGEERHVVGALLRGEAVGQALEDLGRASEDVARGGGG